jgi:hypothetical protein
LKPVQMGLFDKAKDPQEPRESGDNVPLIPVQRKSRTQNTWNDDEQNAEGGSLRRRSSETFHRFSEGEDEEDIEQMSGENGRYRDLEGIGLAKTSIDGPQSVGPVTNPANLSFCCDPGPQNRCCSMNFLHQIWTRMNLNYSKTIPHMRKSELRSRIQMIQRLPA